MRVKSRISNSPHCVCGVALPAHLTGIDDRLFKHICSCERVWKIEGRYFVHDGAKEVNPFTQYHDKPKARYHDKPNRRLVARR